MPSRRRWSQRSAAAALLGGLFFSAAASGQGQGTLPPASAGASDVTVPAGSPADLTTPEASTPVQPPDTVSVDGAVASPLFSPDGCPDGMKCESVWAKVPPPITFPRLGAFFILPTGPGYYSLKDVCTDHYREKPPVYPYPPFLLDVVPFYDNNFRYLDDPNNTQHDFLDPIKRIHLGDDWLLSFGGEERIRYADEYDSRLSGKTNMYELERSRIYGDLWFRDVFRVYAEYGYVEASNEQLPPAATDINKDDIINLFVDLKLFELDDHPVYARGGRQELNYGSQRLISQTDFPNSPRTFDGIKGFWHSDNLDVDAFMTRPVVIDPDHFNSENDKATFDGLWATYRPMKGQAVDLYYLYLDNDTPLTTAPPPPSSRGGFDVNTFGSRYAGDYNYLVWDFEGMYQFGEHGAQDTSAGAYTTGAGLHFAEAPMNPIFWVYYDFASGSHDPGHGEYGTFNQLFPNGHNYFGWTDLVGRQNIDDINFQTWFFPTKWIDTGLQYHILRLDSAKDALYNAAGAVERVDPTGKAGTDVGDVLTGIVNFHLSQHSDFMIQYSHFNSGEFIERTGSPLSPDFVFLQYTFRF